MQKSNEQTPAEIALTAALIEETVAPFTPADPAPVDYLAEFNAAGIPWVPCAPFPCSFVFFQMDNDDHVATFKRLFPDFNSQRKANGTATEYFTETGNYFVLIGWRMHGQYGERLPLLDRIVILTHEIHHAINFVLQHVGQQPDTSNDEITAYLHEYHMKAALLAVGFGEADEWRTNTAI